MADAVHDIGTVYPIGSAWNLQKVGTQVATASFT
jgi:hypothetical protein